MAKMDGYVVTRVVGPAMAGNDFAVIIENKQGEQKAIVLAAPMLTELSDLLNQARHELGLTGPATDTPRPQSGATGATTHPIPVARIEMMHPGGPESPSRHGVFELRLRGRHGQEWAFQMSHDEAIRWRDTLSQQIEAFRKRHSH